MQETSDAPFISDTESEHEWVDVSTARFLRIIVLLSVGFVTFGLFAAYADGATYREGVKGFAIIGMVGALYVIRLFQSSTRGDSAEEAGLDRWKERFLGLGIASIVTALLLDLFVWREAESVVSTSAVATNSLWAVEGLTFLSLVFVVIACYTHHMRVKKVLSALAALALFVAMFAEIALVMTVREPVLPHTAAVLERFTTFFLAVATLICGLYAGLVYADDSTMVEEED